MFNNIVDKFSPRAPVWLGAMRQGEQGSTTWRWLSGRGGNWTAVQSGEQDDNNSSGVYQNWMNGRPWDENGSSECLSMPDFDNGKWNDYYCSAEFYVICKGPKWHK